MDTRIVYAKSHDGVRVAAAVTGSGFPLVNLMTPLLSNVLLPPMPSGGAFLRRLEQRHRLIRPDVRGCGAADWGPASHTLDDYTSDIIALLDTLGIEQTDVLATCPRAPVAVRLAARFPDRVRYLYLQGAAVGANAAEGLPWLRPSGLRLANDDWQLYLETMASRLAGSEAHVAEIVARMRKCCSQENLLAMSAALEAADITEDICALQCPTLVVEPWENTMVDHGQAERFVALVQHAQLRYVSNSPELGWLDDFVTAMEAFEDEQDRARQSTTKDGDLSDREAQVLNLLSSGHTNPQIAATLVLSEATVKSHIAHIYTKLNVRNRAEATRWAMTHGVVPVHA